MSDIQMPQGTITDDTMVEIRGGWVVPWAVADEIERLRGVISAVVSVPRYEPYGDYDNSYRLDLEEGGRYVKFDDLLAALNPSGSPVAS